MARDFVCEIGTEELPALPLYFAMQTYETLVTEGLRAARLSFDKIQCFSTPRRMTVIVRGLSDTSEALSQKMRGPAAAIAFDAQGNPTKAAEGFARGKGLSVEDLFVEEEEGKSYVFCQLETKPQPTKELLGPLMSDIIGHINWPRSQRWGSGHERFARPVRWILALLGDELVEVSFGDIKASNTSCGHRLLAPEERLISCAENYERELDEVYVIVDPQKRAAQIREGIARIEQQTGCLARTPQMVFDEVVNLVEYPQALLAHFDAEFLDIPREIITDAMLKHQRYFPLYKAQGSQKEGAGADVEGAEATQYGALSNGFIITSNGDPARADIIIDGNERVVRARLNDAAFFYYEDAKQPLESYLKKLEKVAFQEKLGSVLQKTERIGELASHLAAQAGLAEETQKQAARAGLLSKADLVTTAVVEFTSLQGIMGGYYARLSGEGEEVAQAISEHYRPGWDGDALPSTELGRLVSLADKLNTITGIFAADKAPTGSSDPYAIRRSTLGVIRLLLKEQAISLEDALHFALNQYREQLDFNFDEVMAKIRAYFRTRLEVWAREEKGYAYDTVAAVSQTTQDKLLDPADFFARVDALEEARKDQPETFLDLATAYARAHNLSDKTVGTAYNEALFEPAESNLAQALIMARGRVDQALASRSYSEALQALSELRKPIDAFFEQVFVADPNEELRVNRFKLLNEFVALFDRLADMTQLVTK